MHKKTGYSMAVAETIKRLLITGASGFLGWNCCRVAAASYRVFGVYHKNLPPLSDATLAKCDLTNPDDRNHLLSEIRPDAIIHTAAASDPNYCQQHPDETDKLNVTLPAALARYAAENHIPFAFTSSDLVFDGTKAPYREADPVCPRNYYGKQKVAAEKGIAFVNSSAAICRMVLMYGDAPPTAKSFLQPWITALATGQSLSLFTDEFRTPLSAINAAQGLLLSLTLPGGIIHLGGPERLSRYTMGYLLAEALGIENPAITASHQKELPMAAPRAADVSLDSSTAIAAGFHPGTMHHELSTLHCLKNWRNRTK